MEPDKLNLKFIEIQEVNTRLKNKVRGLACLNVKINYIVTVDEILCDFFVCYSPHLHAIQILIPWYGIEPVYPALEVLSLNYWTAKEVL